MRTTVRRMIERAGEEYGSEARVAARLGVTRQRLSEWKTGARPIPLPRLAHLASLLGMDEEETITAVVIERHRSGKMRAATVLLASAIAALSSISNDANANPLDARCIMRSRLGRFLATVRPLRRVRALCWVEQSSEETRSPCGALLGLQ